MKPILATGSVVRNFLNSEVGAWPARPIDSSKPFQCQDRRPLKPQPIDDLTAVGPKPWTQKDADCFLLPNSRIKIGDVLYLREAFKPVDLLIDDVDREDPVLIAYKADGVILRHEGDPVKPFKYGTGEEWNLEHPKAGKWRPSLHMPKWASRIHLEVMRVRVGRACDISEEDAKAEGVHVGQRGPVDAGSNTCNVCGKHKHLHIGSIGACPQGYGTSFSNASFAGGFKFLWAQIYGPDAWEKWVWAYDLKRIK